MFVCHQIFGHMLKYSDDVVKAFCASLSGSSAIDAVYVANRKSRLVTSSEEARAFQESTWSKYKTKKNQHILYIGNLCGATDEALIKGHGITHILNVCDRCPNKFPFLTYLSLLVPSEEYDHPEAASIFLSDHIDEMFDFIEDGLKTGSVLIHSTRGASRAFFATAAYLMHRNHWNIDDVTVHIMSLRPSIEPTDHVMNALITFATTHVNSSQV